MSTESLTKPIYSCIHLAQIKLESNFLEFLTRLLLLINAVHNINSDLVHMLSR
jgi:hypothetical protein